MPAISWSSCSTACATTRGWRRRRRASPALGRPSGAGATRRWTAPSHYNLLMGLLPHASPPHVYASEYYKQDFLRYTRAARDGGHGVQAAAAVAVPAHVPQARARLRDPRPGLDAGAQPVHADQPRLRLLRADAGRTTTWRRCSSSCSSTSERPSFWLLNVGETHYPYALPGEDADERPHISGVHGVFKHLDEIRAEGEEPREFFDPARLTDAARAPGRRARVPRRGVRAAVRAAAAEHVADRHLRPRRAVRRGRLLRPRADRAREGARGAVRRGPRWLTAPPAVDGHRAAQPLLLARGATGARAVHAGTGRRPARARAPPVDDHEPSRPSQPHGRGRLPITRVPRPPQGRLLRRHYEPYLTHVPLSYRVLRGGTSTSRTRSILRTRSPPRAGAGAPAGRRCSRTWACRTGKDCASDDDSSTSSCARSTAAMRSWR